MDGLEEGLGEIGEGAGGAGFYIAMEDGGEDAAEGGAKIVGGNVFAGEAIGQFTGELPAERAWDSLRACSKQKLGCLPARGVRHRRPSAKVKRHADARSCKRREDIGGS